MYKHLTIEQRILIEDRLNKHLSIRSIAKELGVAPSTVLREIKRYHIALKSIRNDCSIKFNCIHRGLCKKEGCGKLCSKCTTFKCGKFCVDYVKYHCPKLKSSPYVCNGCKSIPFCELDRKIYKGGYAEKTYRKTLVSSRSGFDVTKEEMQKIDDLASPMIKNGLSPYHVKQTLGETIPVSESTLRRMIDRCELAARSIDLRDKVKRKPRITSLNKYRHKKLSVSKVDHFYEDYLNYLSKNDVFTVEMDCIEGKKGESPVLLTLTWKELSLQIALKLAEKTSKKVVAVLDWIESLLGLDLFKALFPLILTDNGTEFSDIAAMETSKTGVKRTKIFFCDPNRSDQKGTCENHHKMIRYCIPKGTSLLKFTQADIFLMMSHINSYKRKALFGKSAYELAKEVLPKEFFDLIGLREISPDKIILTPELFRHSKCNS